ncbi:hypothetical protein [Microbacterium sp. LWH10-1.2]|uniref:hypothetical protein n=1 Tax=Microbacterium sp. LWH10-1.2 TaxID=3135255 RepID=UPI003138F8B6
MIAVADIPLFVLASALVACGIRWAVWIVVPWTALVAAGMAVYATATTLAGWGALLMALAAMGSIAAGIVIVWPSSRRMDRQRAVRLPHGRR